MPQKATTARRRGRRRRPLVSLVLVGLVVAVGAASAQAQEQAQEQPGTLTVIEQDGHDLTFLASPPPALAGVELPTSAFEVLEAFKDRPAEIVRLAGPEIILVIDTSVSARTLSTVKDALAEFVAALPTSASVGLVAAAEDPVVVAPPGGRAASLDALAGMRRSEGRSILGGLALGAEQFRGGEDMSRALFLVNGSGYHRTGGAPEETETAEAVADSGATLFRFELRQAFLGIAPPSSTLALGGRALALASPRELSPQLERLAVEFQTQYRITTRFTGSGGVNAGVRFTLGGVSTTAFTIVGLPEPPEPPPPSSDSGRAIGDAVPKAAAVLGVVVLVVLLVLVPPRRARARAARASPPPSPVPAMAPGTALPATAAEVGGGGTWAGRRRRSVFVDARRRHLPRTDHRGAGLGGEQVEGRAAVTELLRQRRRRTGDLWLADDLDATTRLELVALAEAAQVPVLHLPPGAVANEARSPDARGVLAHATALPVVRLEQLWQAPGSRPPLLVGIDGPVGEVGLGAVLGIAARAGVSGVVLRRGRTSVITPTVANAAAGAVERLDLAVVGGMVSALATMGAAGVTVVGIESAAPPLDALPPRQLTELATGPLALVFSAGGALDRAVANRCDLRASVGADDAAFDLPTAVESALLALFESSARSTPP